jgi:hypothetical protein
MATEPPVTAGNGGMIARIKALLLQPRDEWPRIAAQPMTPMGIMTGWVVPLAAIGPIAGMIAALTGGVTLYGIPLLNPPISFVIASFVLNWLSAVVCVYVLALLIDALAPSFGGQKDSVAALKVAAFGSTAGFLAGVFQVNAWLMMLGILGLYSYYLIYVGLPVLMKSDKDKTLVYMIATFVISILLFAVAGYFVQLISYSMLPPVPYGIN